ncbi:unnamed protein product [Adineta ricciae]|uniref:Uncharacterized protein n=1 Tax=Adineta ricciae TaxID=249248 RepID=A0A815MW89_ADIRI|nr:unnamed protein product [Adineta ricciae]
MRWFLNTNQSEILIHNIDCWRLTMDKFGFIYVCDDLWNYRVMKWRKDAQEGIVVAGGNGRGENLNQLNHPQGIIVDHEGRIYVADMYNHRIMRWCGGDKEGEIIVGANGKGEEPNQLAGPCGLSFDDEGNLYVVDWGNHRIQRFDFII